jgi:hypothetical protein
MSDPIHADDGVLDAVHEEFRHLGAELRDANDAVSTQADHIAAGAGQFADALADGVDAFRLSWEAAFDATSETAGTIAANVGHFKLDLHAVDIASS